MKKKYTIEQAQPRLTKSRERLMREAAEAKEKQAKAERDRIEAELHEK